MNAISGTALVLRVKMDITVQDVAIDVYRTALNVQIIITVTDAHQAIGD